MRGLLFIMLAATGAVANKACGGGCGSDNSTISMTRDTGSLVSQIPDGQVQGPATSKDTKTTTHSHMMPPPAHTSTTTSSVLESASSHPSESAPCDKSKPVESASETKSDHHTSPTPSASKASSSHGPLVSQIPDGQVQGPTGPVTHASAPYPTQQANSTAPLTPSKVPQTTTVTDDEADCAGNTEEVVRHISGAGPHPAHSSQTNPSANTPQQGGSAPPQAGIPKGPRPGSPDASLHVPGNAGPEPGSSIPAGDPANENKDEVGSDDEEDNMAVGSSNATAPIETQSLIATGGASTTAIPSIVLVALAAMMVL